MALWGRVRPSKTGTGPSGQGPRGRGVTSPGGDDRGWPPRCRHVSCSVSLGLPSTPRPRPRTGSHTPKGALGAPPRQRGVKLPSLGLFYAAPQHAELQTLKQPGPLPGPSPADRLQVSPPGARGWPHGSHVPMRGTQCRWKPSREARGSPSAYSARPGAWVRRPAQAARLQGRGTCSGCRPTVSRGRRPGDRNTYMQGATCMPPSGSLCLAHVKANVLFPRDPRATQAAAPQLPHGDWCAEGLCSQEHGPRPPPAVPAGAHRARPGGGRRCRPAEACEHRSPMPSSRSFPHSHARVPLLHVTKSSVG